MANMNKIRDKLVVLPKSPGCYLMKDINGKVIYVGKAKILRNRVKSYFNGVHNYKTTKLVSNIDDFEFIVTNSEKEALLLEINLIKEYDPKYNIIFTDDKTYPYIRLNLKGYPSLSISRNTKDKKSLYFGPYPNSGAAYDVLHLLNGIYPLRKCHTMPKKVCLFYHINQCLGPCEYEVEQNKYEDIVNGIKKFLNGDVDVIRNKLIEERDSFSEVLNFELAKEKQNLISSIDHIVDKQQINFKDYKNRDVFAFYYDKGYMSIQAFLIRFGKIVQRKFEMKAIYDEEEDYFKSYLLQYYQHNPKPKELILTSEIDFSDLSDILEVCIVQPKIGNKLKLLKLVEENAYKTHRQSFEISKIKDDSKESALSELSMLLNININTIEVFDNSHISGSHNVSAMVVYEDGKPKKSKYRLFKLATYRSDFDSMKEVISRRYTRVKKESLHQADLIIVDGGDLQINAAKQILDELDLNIYVAGLVKDDKHRTSHLIDANGELIAIKADSPLFFFLTNMQDEVHRFVINYHRKLRSKAMTKSILDDVTGIGPVSKKKIWKEFKTLSNLRNATIDDLNTVLDIKIAEELYHILHNDNKS